VGGENESGSPKMNLGRFSTSTLAVTAGVVDTARGGNTSPSSTVFTGGSYTAPDPTTGRATLTLTVSGGSITFAYYIIDANRAFLLETSAGDGLQAGNVRKQQQGSYSGANLSGAFVLYMQGYDFDSPGSSTVSGYYSSVFQGTGSGSGNMTINQSYQDDNGTYKVGDANGGPIAVTFDSSNPGRSSFVPGAGTGYLYFFNNNQAMEMDIDSNGAMESGWMEAQSGTFTPAGVAGTYMLGQMPSLGVNMDSGVGQITSTSSGTVSGTSTDAGEGDFNYLQPFSGTFAFDGTAPGTGTYIVSANGQPQLSCAVISSSKAVCINQTSSSPSVLILQK